MKLYSRCRRREAQESVKCEKILNKFPANFTSHSLKIHYLNRDKWAEDVQRRVTPFFSSQSEIVWSTTSIDLHILATLEYRQYQSMRFGFTMHTQPVQFVLFSRPSGMTQLE